MEGVAAAPAGIVSEPVIVSPVLRTFNDAAPITAAVTEPALKFPEASRDTIAFAVFALVAVVAELFTLPAVVIVASLPSLIAADALISAFTIKELLKFPEASLWTTPAV